MSAPEDRGAGLPLPEPPAGCLSDRLLDIAVAGGELPGPARAHLEICARCSARRVALADLAAVDAPAVARLAARVSAEVERRRQRVHRFFWTGAFAAATAAAALLLTLPRSTDDAGDVRAKGESMRLVVRRGGENLPGPPSDGFRPGDALRFVVSTSSRHCFLLVGIDEASGRVTAYHPWSGDRCGELPAGIDVPLPGSLVLDESRATELIVGLFGDAPFTVKEVEAAVAAARALHGARWPEARHLELPARQQWLTVRRAP